MKWVMFSIATVFIVAVALAEANCGPNWVDEVMVKVGGWILRRKHKSSNIE